MAKIRVLIFLSTLVVVGIIGVFASFYARGYRFDIKKLKFEPNGILVIKSEPDGASIYVNGDLKTATNATISLSPGTYDVEVKKEGFFTWSKRLVIEKEIVTQANVSLFKNVPSLSPITFFGAENPVVSEDGTKIAFVVPPSKDLTQDKIGLWTIDTFNLPLGFSKDPKRILDGNLEGSSYSFSPDGRQILLTTSKGVYLVDTGSFTPQNQLTNIAAKKALTLADWDKERGIRNASLIKNLPPEMIDILERKVANFIFSPDDNMVLYTASGSGNLPENLIKQLPGASTQKQERQIADGQTYIYDIKEDRNFVVYKQKINLDNSIFDPTLPAIRWLTTSRHLLLAEEGKITIMDYDGTNKQIIYSGAYTFPYAYPFANTTKLLVLTNLGGTSSTSNLYTLTIK